MLVTKYRCKSIAKMDTAERGHVNDLRNRLDDACNSIFSDFDLLRWIYGYDNDLDVIVPKLKRHYCFLISYDWKNYAMDDVMSFYWSFGLLGPSGVDDSLLLIDCKGRVDGEGILKSLSVGRIAKCLMINVFKVIDKIHEFEAATGRQWSITYIFDMEHFVLDEKQWRLVKGPFRLLINFLMEHCVEIASKFIIVNAPSYLYYLFKVVKAFLPEKTRRKVFVLGSEWRKEILDFASPGNLPKHWGGTLTDKITGDEFCSSVITVPPTKVDAIHFWIANEDKLNNEELSVLTVGPWKVDSITVYVSKENTSLKWHFWASSDFGFGVFHLHDDEVFDKNTIDRMGENDGVTVVFPYGDHLPGPSTVPEADEVMCTKPGFYKLVFNNSFSWMCSLKISYSVALVND